MGPETHAFTTALRRLQSLAVVLVIAFGTAGCELVEGIFRVGFWAGAIIVAVLLAVVWLIARSFR